MKILAIQFRYLGDAVLMTPALRAMRQHFSGCELHVLVAEEVAPLLRHVPWVDRLWALPRKRGKARFKESWPLIRALRRERFDRSVDFGSGDRSAIISLLCGAPERLAPLWPGGFLGRRYFYTRTLVIPESLHEARRHLRLLAVWGVPEADLPELEIRADPVLIKKAAVLLSHPAILCHLTAGQPKKEWPLDRWAELYHQARSAGHELVFSAGATPREQNRLEEFRQLLPEARTIPLCEQLDMYLAVLKRARLLVTADTGPLHFAAGLGIPTVSLFGPSSARQWAPLGQKHRSVQAPGCTCGWTSPLCQSPTACTSKIDSKAVLDCMEGALAAQPLDSGVLESGTRGKSGDLP